MPTTSSSYKSSHGRVRRSNGITASRRSLTRGATGDAALSSRLIMVMAFAVGLIAANLYYSQPLLSEISHSVHASASTIGLTVTVMQIAFAVGLVAVVPAGDVLGRRRLLSMLMVTDACGLMLLAFAPSGPVVIAACLIVGLTNVSAQLIVPIAASLAAPSERGHVTASVISGLLVGILMARTIAGVVASAVGWRALYAGAAIAMLCLLAVLIVSLPTERASTTRIRYTELLRSTWMLFLSNRRLQVRAVFGALGFAAFSAFWTTIALLLTGPQYGFGPGKIGIFALLGVAGAVAAKRTGRLADRGHHRVLTLAAAVSIVLAFGDLALGSRSLPLLILGTVLMDMGVQALHVTNQHLIYEIAPDAPARVNSSYMTVYFVGGAFGSAAGTVAYSLGGWHAVCALGAGLGAMAVLLWVTLDGSRDTRLPQ
jgi:predicted MFS family arabinose efflux permease